MINSVSEGQETECSISTFPLGDRSWYTTVSLHGSETNIDAPSPDSGQRLGVDNDDEAGPVILAPLLYWNPNSQCGRRNDCIVGLFR